MQSPLHHGMDHEMRPKDPRAHLTLRQLLGVRLCPRNTTLPPSRARWVRPRCGIELVAALARQAPRGLWCWLLFSSQSFVLQGLCVWDKRLELCTREHASKAILGSRREGAWTPPPTGELMGGHLGQQLICMLAFSESLSMHFT